MQKGLIKDEDELITVEEAVERGLHFNSEDDEPFIRMGRGNAADVIEFLNNGRDKRIVIAHVGFIGAGKSAALHEILRQKIEEGGMILIDDVDNSLISEHIMRQLPLLSAQELTRDAFSLRPERSMDELIKMINETEIQDDTAYLNFKKEELVMAENISKEGKWPTFRGYNKRRHK